MATGYPVAAICVQDVDVQSSMQFTLIHTVGCTLHRHTSRVIHRSKLYSYNPTHRFPRCIELKVRGCSLGASLPGQRTCSPARSQVHARQQTREWQAKPDRLNSVKRSKHYQGEAHAYSTQPSSNLAHNHKVAHYPIALGRSGNNSHENTIRACDRLGTPVKVIFICRAD